MISQHLTLSNSFFRVARNSPRLVLLRGSIKVLKQRSRTLKNCSRRSDVTPERVFSTFHSHTIALPLRRVLSHPFASPRLKWSTPWNKQHTIMLYSFASLSWGSAGSIAPAVLDPTGISARLAARLQNIYRLSWR